MNEEIRQKCIDILDRDNWTCRRCGEPATEVAHRISKGKTGIRWVQNYLMDVLDIYMPQTEIEILFIHDPDNLAASCKDCNDYFNILYNPEKAKELVKKIAKKHDLI